MNYKGVEICCPGCGGELQWPDNSRERMDCVSCHAWYPVICDIPDLRIFADPYIGIDDDLEKGRGLAEAAATRKLPELIDHYYASTSVVTPQQAALYRRGLLAAGGRAVAALDMWEKSAGLGSPGRLLEVGCGTAPLMIAAQRRGYEVVGVDIAFRWLIVGQQRLREAGLDLPLICACAEALPFPDGQYDRIVLDSVIEHVRDQDRVPAQCSRVAVPDAALYLATPNRFSIGPDPHTGFPAGSLYPAAMTAALVRRQGGIPPRRQLLSVFALRRKLADAGFARTRVFLPDVPAAQQTGLNVLLRMAIVLYHVLKRLPGTRHLLYLVGPLLYSSSLRQTASGQ